MAMTLRADKGAILSWNEMDANFKACMGAHNFLQIDERKAVGTAAGAFTSGAWRTRQLSTVVVNSLSGASLVSNQVILQAGYYYVSGFAHAYLVGINVARLQVVSPSTSTLITGDACYAHASYGALTVANISGSFEISAQSTIEMQHVCATTSANGFGALATTDIGQDYNLYAQLLIWKLS